MSLLFGSSYRAPAGGRSRLLWRCVLEAQRVRRAPPVESGTYSRRTPFCACSSVEQLQGKADFAFAGIAGGFGVSVAGADGAVHVASEARHRGAGAGVPEDLHFGYPGLAGRGQRGEERAVQDTHDAVGPPPVGVPDGSVAGERLLASTKTSAATPSA